MEKLAVRYRMHRIKDKTEEEMLAVTDLRRDKLYEHIEKVIAYAETMFDDGSDEMYGWEDTYEQIYGLE